MTILLNIIKPYKSQFDFTHQGEYIQYLKDYNFKPFALSLHQRGVKNL